MADGVARDVFISHEKHDSDLAQVIADRLDGLGFSTWYYERDSAAGGSYLVQIDRAIEAAGAVIVIVSHDSVKSPHVRNEVIRAYESRKRFLPVRRNIGHPEMLSAHDDSDDERRREWRMAFGASVSLAWDNDNPDATITSMSHGLRQFGIVPGAVNAPAAQGVPDPRPVRRATTTWQRALRAPIVRTIALVAIALLGVVFSLRNLAMAFSDPTVLHFFRYFPAARYVNVLANVGGLWVFGRLTQQSLLVFQGRHPSTPAVRSLASVQCLIVVGWTIGSLVIALSAPANFGKLRTDYIVAILVAAIAGGAPVALLRYLYSDRP